MSADTSNVGGSNEEALEQLLLADAAAFQAVAGWHSPILDRVLPPLSQSANNSVLWMGIAAVIAVLGGRRGRLVAAEALLATGATSAIANLAAKNLVRRTRPETSVPKSRRVKRPDTSSFPSGHTASAAAFSAIVGNGIASLYVPINVAAASVGFSRVYTGVHYPGDVLAGWMLGRLVAGTINMLWPKKWR